MEQIFYTQTKRGRSMLSDMFAENASECTTKMWILLTPVCWVQRIQTTTPQCSGPVEADYEQVSDVMPQ
ncbi:Immunoglobulin superfamily member [Trichinella spiralis]|uniref:Immunoglobulin superfamily member n=1 Tax=Trichinella spiralis TaxID=6334 RepID=A0ABR3KT87_TRISP